MGQRIHVEMYDDTDPDQVATHTDELLVNGKIHEIDLSEENHQRLMELLAPFVAASRRKDSKPKPVKATPVDRSKIRAWARRNGYPTIGDRGVLPAGAIEEFHKFAGKDKPKQEFTDPDPVPPTKEFAQLSDEEQNAVQVWIIGLGLKWPRAKEPRNRIAMEAWGDRNETLAKEILEDYVR